MKRKKHWTQLNKLEKHQALLSEPSLRQNLPATVIYKPQRLMEFLNKYSVLYLKPYKGTGGKGIIRVANVGKKWLVQYDLQKKEYSDRNKLIKAINSLINRKIYLIQQGINLISINNRPIDFRILILKPYQKWELMGIMGKLAAKNKIVTNRSRGGEAITLANAVSSCLKFSPNQVTILEQYLTKKSFTIANTLEKHFNYVREVGIDIGIDNRGKMWILETNSMPGYHLFSYDRKLYQMIDQYIKHIRRNYRRKSV